MTTPETPPPGGEEPGRGLSGGQRSLIVLGALAVLLIVFVVLRGGDGSGSDSSTSSSAQSASTAGGTSGATAGTGGSGTTRTGDSATTSTGDNGSGGSGSDDSGAQTAGTQTQPSAPAVPTVRVVNGQPQGGVKRLEATKGERVRFKVQSDVADEVHVHGYDVKKNVPKGGSVTFSFAATIEGRFEIELENAHTQIAELEVKPS